LRSDKVSTNVNLIISKPTYPTIKPIRGANIKFLKIRSSNPCSKCTTKKTIFTLVKNLNWFSLSILTQFEIVR
jgi:hypothetical protein